MSPFDTAAQSDQRLILLSPNDNVMVVGRKIGAGETLLVAGIEVQAKRELPLGHKIACRAISVGEKVKKYGAPIGSATQAIEVGDHVHVHNLKSDYTATHLIETSKHEP